MKEPEITINANTIFVGATKNENPGIDGWLPYVVDRSALYRVMIPYGSFYSDYQSGVYATKDDAIKAAKRWAEEDFANNGDAIEIVPGCRRCWNDRDPRHLKWVGEDTRCGHCNREIPQWRSEDE